MVKREKKILGYNKERFSFRQAIYATPKEKIGFAFPFKTFKKIFFLGVILWLVYYIFFSKLFLINEVIIEGNKLVAKDDVARLVPMKKNIFLIHSLDLKKNILRSFPEVRDAVVYKGIPNTVKIILIEREPSIVWQSGGDYYLISDSGEVAKKIGNEEFKNLPLVVDKKNLPLPSSGSVVSPSFIAFALNIYNEFFSEVNVKPDHFEIGETTFDLNLFTADGFYVKFNSLRRSKKQLSDLKSVLAAKRADIHEYVDLRIDGWGYYK